MATEGKEKYLLVEDYLGMRWAMPDFKRLHEDTETLINELTAAPQDPSRFFAAVYEYLMAKATDRPVDPESEQFVMQFLALAIEGEAQSIAVNRQKRRTAMAVKEFLHRRLFFKTEIGKVNPTTHCINVTAKRFGISPESLRKRIERRGLHRKRIKMTAELTLGEDQADTPSPSPIETDKKRHTCP